MIEWSDVHDKWLFRYGRVWVTRNLGALICGRADKWFRNHAQPLLLPTPRHVLMAGSRGRMYDLALLVETLPRIQRASGEGYAWNAQWIVDAQQAALEVGLIIDSLRQAGVEKPGDK